VPAGITKVADARPLSWTRTVRKNNVVLGEIEMVEAYKPPAKR
jgi:hypothetical protein